MLSFFRRNVVLILGLLLQVIVYVIAPAHPISLVSGLMGVCSVVLSAQRNIWTFFFGFAQVLTYSYLCWGERFYAELLLNAYYFVTMLYGVWVWHKHLGVETEKFVVETRKLSLVALFSVCIATLLFSILVGWLLAVYTDDSQPYMDAFTTVPAMVAQILMILVYREQWCIWLLVDILATLMWVEAGDYCMAAQYIFWCGNCIYGYVLWSRSTRD